MSTARAEHGVHGLTGLALWLLDVPFEPACPTSGELFDLTMDHVATHLLETASCLATGAAPPVRRLPLPEPDPSRRRHDRMLLRRAVLGGRHPAVLTTLAEAPIRCQQAITRLAEVRREVPADLVASLGTASALLATTARTIEAYRRCAIRVRRDLAEVEPSPAQQANLAARAERDLVRRLRRGAEASYGVRTVSVTLRLAEQVADSG